MACNSINLSNIPACLVTDGEAIVGGITITGYEGDSLMCKITNTATGKQVLIPVTADGSGLITDLDIASIYNLMDHRYLLEFFTEDFAPVIATVQDEAGDSFLAKQLYFSTIQAEIDGTITVKAI